MVRINVIAIVVVVMPNVVMVVVELTWVQLWSEI